MLGEYGAWAARLNGAAPAALSFRSANFKSLPAWRRQALFKVRELLAAPTPKGRPKARVERRFEYEGLAMEELSWQLPYGPRTQALFIRPADARGRLPAVLAVHDHGGNKYFGVQKIVKTSTKQHPLMAAHQEKYSLIKIRLLTNSFCH